MLSSQAVASLRRLVHQTAGFTQACLVGSVRAAGDLLFPPCCAFCQVPIAADADRAMFCRTCADRFSRPRVACRRCASPLPPFWKETPQCGRCQHRRYHFERVEALGDYQTELQQAVLWMKRLSFEPLTQAMGRLLGHRVSAHLGDWQADWVIPIPMHFLTRLKRGTHTAHVLGGQVARHLRLPLQDGVLVCRRKSRKQGTLTRSERFKNRRGAFCISSGYDITDKRVLLVDDIMTTGATASEAARVLRQAGAAEVAVAVVARGIGRR